MARVYFRQWLAGREFAVGDASAAQMANFVYAIGDEDKRVCVLVDPAWDVSGILGQLESDGMTLVGVLATHYHPDHVGGPMFGLQVEGLRELLAKTPVPIHLQAEEADGVRMLTGASASDLVSHHGGDVVQVGDVPIQLLHTPGHTPGSQCFLVDDKLVAGDTLFVQGCGRVDLPGGNPEEMYRTLTQRLTKVPDHVVLFPGHDYADRPSSTLGDERRTNTYMRVPDLDAWLRMMSGGF